MIIDSWLIPANAIIIAGASITANLQNSDNLSELSQSEIDNKKTISKVLRTLGQSIFFALTVIWVAFLANTAIKVQRRRGIISGAKTVLGLFTIVGFMLCTRGMFGILQAAIESVSCTKVPINLSCRTPPHQTMTAEALQTASWLSSIALLLSPSLLRTFYMNQLTIVLHL